MLDSAVNWPEHFKILANGNDAVALVLFGQAVLRFIEQEANSATRLT
jgi:hypothetical protein